MKKILAFLILFGFASSSCEPDDICDPTTPTTPRMLIQFFDFKTSQKKSVNNLKVIGKEMKEGVILNPTATGDDRYVSNTDNILLPLNTEADLVQYEFINYSDNPNPLLETTDNLEFRYTRENYYVSRACGFKTIFNLDPTNPFTLTSSETTGELWIKHIVVVQDNITFENETIIKIYF